MRLVRSDVGAQPCRCLAKLAGHPAKACALALIGREVTDQIAIIGIIEQFAQPGLQFFHGLEHERAAAEKEQQM